MSYALRIMHVPYVPKSIMYLLINRSTVLTEIDIKPLLPFKKYSLVPET